MEEKELIPFRCCALAILPLSLEGKEIKVRRYQQTDLSAEAQAFLHYTLGVRFYFVAVRLPLFRSPWRTWRPKSPLGILPFFRILSSI